MNAMSIDYYGHQLSIFFLHFGRSFDEFPSTALLRAWIDLEHAFKNHRRQGSFMKICHIWVTVLRNYRFEKWINLNIFWIICKLRRNGSQLNWTKHMIKLIEYYYALQHMAFTNLNESFESWMAARICNWWSNIDKGCDFETTK